MREEIVFDSINREVNLTCSYLAALVYLTEGFGNKKKKNVSNIILIALIRVFNSQYQAHLLGGMPATSHWEECLPLNNL